MAQTSSKKGKRRRVSKAKISAYWNERHCNNMVRRAFRILNKEGRSAADKFVALHGANCKPCDVFLDARYRKVVG